MKTKKQPHVDKQQNKKEQREEQKITSQELTIHDQLELFADILIDIYLNEVYEEENN